MELDHVVLADVISARPDGKLDMHGVGWDTIFAPGLPVTHPRMDLAVRFLLTSQETEVAHAATVVLVDADGSELARIHNDIAPLDESQRAAVPPGRRVGLGMVIVLAGVRFNAYGPHNLMIMWDGTEVRSVSLFVAPVPGLAT